MKSIQLLAATALVGWLYGIPAYAADAAAGQKPSKQLATPVMQRI